MFSKPIGPETTLGNITSRLFGKDAETPGVFDVTDNRGPLNGCHAFNLEDSQVLRNKVKKDDDARILCSWKHGLKCTVLK